MKRTGAHGTGPQGPQEAAKFDVGTMKASRALGILDWMWFLLEKEPRAPIRDACLQKQEPELRVCFKYLGKNQSGLGWGQQQTGERGRGRDGGCLGELEMHVQTTGGAVYLVVEALESGEE